MKRVIVTGGSGFIGRHALPVLRERGFEVHAFDLPGSCGGGDDGVAWHAVDLLDPAAVERTVEEISATHLLHFAWFVRHSEFWSAAENLDWVAASLRLVRAFHRAGGRRAVVAGTCAEYDWTAGGRCKEHRTPIAPHTLYGTAKDALRRVLAKFSATWSMEWAWGRIFLVYGPGEHPARLVPSLVHALRRGENARCRSANLVRDLMYSEDCGRAFAELLDSAVIGPVNVASGVEARLGDVAREIAALCRAEDRLFLEDQACSAETPAVLVADTRRLRDEVGFLPRFGLREGILRLLGLARPG